MNQPNRLPSEFEVERTRSGPESWLPQVAANAIDLRRWYVAFRRRLRLFIAVGVTVFVASALLTLQTTPKYTATASVVLDTRKERVSNVEQVLSDLPAETAVVDTEVEVMRSGQLAGRVVKALRLDEDPEFNGSLRKPTGMQAVVAGIKGMFGAAAPRPTRPSAQQLERQYESVVNAVQGRQSVQRVGLTYVIRLGFTSQDPAKAAAIADKFAELYLLDQLEAKFEATEQATRWLNQQLDKLRQQVIRDEGAVQQFKIANNLLSASGTTLTEQEISTYNQTLTQARAQLAEDEARLSAARIQLARANSGTDVGEALNSGLIGTLRSQRALASAQVADLQGRYGERHPEMLKAKRQLSDIDAQIEEEIRSIIANLETKVQVSRQRAQSVGGSLGGAKGLLEANNRALVRLNELQRNAEASKTLYESYLNRYKETSSQGGVGQSDARIVSKAKVPGAPSSPDVSRNLMLGLLLALGAAGAAAVLAEMIDSGLTTADDVERRLGIAYLGSVPLLSSITDNIKEAPTDYVVSKPLSSFAEAFRILQATIPYARLGEPVKVVAVTSALPGEGKTTTAVCLARSAALQGRRVLVVDCDLRRRTVNQLLAEEPKVGLLEVLNGEATLQEAISVDATGAHTLPLAPSKFTPKDVFGTVAMDRLLVELRSRFDLVILDTAPVLPVADTRVLAHKADLVVFLARWRKTPQPAIEAAFRLLSATGVSIGGVVLTQVDMKLQSKYGYGDPGYYYDDYKKYYVS